MNFSENLKKELEYQDIQVKELAAKTGISKNTLDKYLSVKKVQPGIENAVKIASCLGVSVEYLVTGKHSNKNGNNFNRYFSVINELKSLPKPIQENIIKTIHSVYESFN